MTVRLVNVQYFTWTCPDCGAQNRHNGRVIRDKETLRGMSEEMGEDFEVGDLVEQPRQVACHTCEATHETLSPYGDDEG